jgi:hypothetical protein
MNRQVDIYENLFNELFNDHIMQYVQEHTLNTETTLVHRTNEEFLNNLPSTINEESVRCSICLDDIDPDTPMHKLPCGHCFCIPRKDACDGIRPWLSEHNTCPMCKYELPEEMGNSSTGGLSTNNTESTEDEEEFESMPPLLPESTVYPIPRSIGLSFMSLFENNEINDPNQEQFSIYRTNRSNSMPTLRRLRRLRRIRAANADEDIGNIGIDMTDMTFNRGFTYNRCEDEECAYCIYVNETGTEISRRSQLLGFYHGSCPSAVQLILNQGLPRDEEINMVASL